MHILIAPNAFKNSLSAPQAADLIASGLQESKLECTMETFPIGDGGDGTARMINHYGKGAVGVAQVHDPLGRQITASYGMLDGGRTAVLDLAEASGLKWLKESEYNPLAASTRGTGELIRDAVQKGAKKILLGVGGSATVDGGCGILQSMGIRFLGSSGKPLNILPAELVQLEQIDFSGLDPAIRDIELIILCDVENKLLGQDGAAGVFGPQKGATSQVVDRLEASLQQLTDITRLQTGLDLGGIVHGGAAGGVAASLHCFLGARLVSGIEYFLDITAFDEALDRSDILITGEGSIDIQTLFGKGPYGVARRARQRGVPVIGLAGQVPVAAEPALKAYFDVLISTGNQPSGLQDAMEHAAENLQRTASEMGNLMALGKGGIRRNKRNSFVGTL